MYFSFLENVQFVLAIIHEVPHLFSSEGECILPSDIEMSKTTQYVKPLKTKTL